MICACGCNNELEPFDKYGRPHKFIHGHNRRGKTGFQGEYDTRRGKLHCHWKNGKYINWYKRVGGIREHRLVYETYYKCSLLPNSVIHHINGNKQDNRIENLQVMSNPEHTRMHMKK